MAINPVRHNTVRNLRYSLMKEMDKVNETLLLKQRHSFKRMSSCKNLISICTQLRLHSFDHVGICCFVQLTNMYGVFACARTIPLYGAIARARLLISNRYSEYKYLVPHKKAWSH